MRCCDKHIFRLRVNLIKQRGEMLGSLLVVVNKIVSIISCCGAGILTVVYPSTSCTQERGAAVDGVSLEGLLICLFFGLNIFDGLSFALPT